VAKKKVKKEKVVQVAQGVKVVREKGGRGYTAIIAGNTSEEVWQLVQDMQAHAMQMGLDQVEILSIQPSPAGGWEATLRCHNFNPIKFIKEKGSQAYQSSREKVSDTMEARRLQKEIEKKEEERERKRLLKKAKLELGSIPSGKEDSAVRAMKEREKTEFKTKEELAKYGIPLASEDRVVTTQVPQTDSNNNIVYDAHGKPKMIPITQTIPGRKYSPGELATKLRRVKAEVGPSKKRLIAEATLHGIAETVKLGSVTAAAGSGATLGASTRFGRGSFKRGSQTFGPSIDAGSDIAYPSSARRTMMAAVVPTSTSPVAPIQMPSPTGAGLTRRIF